VLKVSLHRRVLECNLVEYVVELREKWVHYGLLRLLSLDSRMGSLVEGFVGSYYLVDWLVLLFNLVDHCRHDTANAGAFRLHFIHNAREVLKVPVTYLIITAHCCGRINLSLDAL